MKVKIVFQKVDLTLSIPSLKEHGMNDNEAAALMLVMLLFNNERKLFTSDFNATDLLETARTEVGLNYPEYYAGLFLRTPQTLATALNGLVSLGLVKKIKLNYRKEDHEGTARLNSLCKKLLEQQNA